MTSKKRIEKKNDKDLETVKLYQYKDWIVTTIYKL